MAKAKTAKNGNSKKQAVDVGGVLGEPIVRGEARNEARSNSNGANLSNLEAEIRRRAYELYERRGGEPGHESEDWLIAEQEIVARYQQVA